MENPLTKTGNICSVKLKKKLSVKMEYPLCKSGIAAV
jgi:hypothetical protein